MKKKIIQLRWIAAMIMLVAAMVMPSTAWAQDVTYTNGFGSDGSYQHATLTTDQHDINGDGTKDEVYEIGNAGQLYWFAALVNGELGDETQNTSANAVLTANITVNTDVLKSDGTLNNNGSGFEPWTPIGFSFPYEGTFDGQGHTISGLYFKDVYASHVGLFGYSSGTIRNVGVIDSYFKGSNYIGGVCGYNHAEGDLSQATIENCYNTGTVSGNFDTVGGVCGSNGGKITGCYNTGTVSGNSNVGGVCGYGTATIENCYNTGSVSGNIYIGGVCGYNHAEGKYPTVTIENCYNTGTVSGYDNVGGVCGYNHAKSEYSTVTIENCYNTGTVSCNGHYAGGVCGYNYAEGEYSKATIENCYNTGTVSGSGSNVGGVCGANQALDNCTAPITNCYYNSEKYTGNAIGTNDGTVTNVEGKTTEQFSSGEVCYLMNNGITDGTLTWHQNIDMEGATKDPYPVLDNTHGVVYQCSVCTSAYSNTEGAKGAHDYVDDGNGFLTCEACGTKSYQPATLNASSQYEISNAGQLYWFAALVNGELGGETQNTSANAVLTANITVNTGVLDSYGNLNNNGSGFETWTPIIGNAQNPYKGTFDGDNHTISGLYFDNSELNNVGFFGRNSGTIKNVGVVDSYFCGNENVGGVCGDNVNGGTITGCYNKGSVSGSSGYVGGLNNYVGGVCGLNGGTITGCYNTGSVSGNSNIGGVCGGNGGTITGCYNKGSVSGKSNSGSSLNNYVGGVCGLNSGTITGCYNTGTVSGSDSNVGGVCGENGGTITGCYNTGSVSGSGSIVGGVCGENVGTITDCYNTGTVIGSGSNTGGVCGFNGCIITGCYTNNGGVCGNDNGTLDDCGENTNFTNGTVCPLLNKALKKVNASVRFYRGANYPELIMNVPSLVEGVYQISNKEELYAFALVINKNVETSANAKLTADIVVNSGLAEGKTMLESLEYDAVSGKVTNGSSFVAWTPMGYYKSDDDYVEYKGTFDGQGHTISGLYFNDVNASYVGLFGRNSGTIKNVGVVDSYFCGNDWVGGVCGNNVHGGTIIGCYNTGSVSGNSNIGGGVCGGNGGTITGCYNTGEVSGNEYVGGVCGYNYRTITGCYSTGSVSGNYLSGGVCGYNEGTITNCYYLASNDYGNGGKTNNQFKSGEVAYLLSQGSTVTDGENTTYYSGASWGQRLGTDDYPVLGSDYKVIMAAQDGLDGTNYWATFSNLDSNAELIDPKGNITVYNATVSSGTLTLAKRMDNKVSSGEGVLLKASSEYVNAKNISDEVSDATTGENDLLATPAKAGVLNDTNYKHYRLTYNDVKKKEGIGFYLGVVKDETGKVTSNDGSQIRVTPGKAYLKVSIQAATEPSTAKLARGFAFPGDGETTGIECITVTDESLHRNGNAEGIFDLQGRKVSKPTKGVYIKNNKLFLN